MKRLLPVLLTICLLWSMAPAGQAAEGAASPAPMATPAPSQEPPAQETPAPSTPVPEAAALYIDDQNLYPGMGKSYSQGYVPTVEQGQALVVLPLLCDTPLRGDWVRVRISLGEGGPFVSKNYERTIRLTENPVNGGRGKAAGYLLSLALELRPGRENGSFPVTVTAVARDMAGNPVEEAFTLYVNITDGKDSSILPTPEPVAPEPTPEPVPLGPKLLIQSCRVESLEEGAQEGSVNAGDRLRVSVVLLNSSKSETLENMSLTAQLPEGFALLSPTDSLYVESLGPGQTMDAVFDCQAPLDAPAGQYALGLGYDFAYHNGLTAQGTGTVRLNIRQPLELEFTLGGMPAEAVLSDTVQISVQAINLSRAKAYNVRAKLEGDGLAPAGTAFLGDVEGGVSAEKPLQVTITSLTGSEVPYGQTTGTITYLFEDGEGVAHEQSESFSLTIKSPFSAEKAGQAADKPGQWWVIMALLGGAALGFAAFFAVRALRRRRI